MQITLLGVITKRGCPLAHRTSKRKQLKNAIVADVLVDE